MNLFELVGLPKINCMDDCKSICNEDCIYYENREKYPEVTDVQTMALLELFSNIDSVHYILNMHKSRKNNHWKIQLYNGDFGIGKTIKETLEDVISDVYVKLDDEQQQMIKNILED